MFWFGNAHLFWRRLDHCENIWPGPRDNFFEDIALDIPSLRLIRFSDAQWVPCSRFSQVKGQESYQCEYFNASIGISSSYHGPSCRCCTSSCNYRPECQTASKWWYFSAWEYIWYTWSQSNHYSFSFWVYQRGIYSSLATTVCQSVHQEIRGVLIQNSITSTRTQRMKIWSHSMWNGYRGHCRKRKKRS